LGVDRWVVDFMALLVYSKNMEETIMQKKHPWPTIAWLSLCLLMLGALASCGRSNPYIESATSHDSPFLGKVGDADFDKEVLEHGQPVLVDFWATWCGPCLTMAPIVEELAQEHTDRVKVVKMDVDQNPETARAYGISAIPTFIVFNEGKEVTRYTGSTSKRGLESMLEQVAGVKGSASNLLTSPNP